MMRLRSFGRTPEKSVVCESASRPRLRSPGSMGSSATELPTCSISSAMASRSCRSRSSGSLAASTVGSMAEVSLFSSSPDGMMVEPVSTVPRSRGSESSGSETTGSAALVSPMSSSLKSRRAAELSSLRSSGSASFDSSPSNLGQAAEVSPFSWPGSRSSESGGAGCRAVGCLRVAGRSLRVSTRSGPSTR